MFGVPFQERKSIGIGLKGVHFPMRLHQRREQAGKISNMSAGVDYGHPGPNQSPAQFYRVFFMKTQQQITSPLPIGRGRKTLSSCQRNQGNP
jgi:hypothetical protein